MKNAACVFAALLLLTPGSVLAQPPATTNQEPEVAATPPPHGVEPPTLASTRLRRPLPRPYNPNADAWAEVVAASNIAKENGKHLLIDFGGNWCPDCLILAGMMRLPGFAEFIEAHYEVVHVDVGRFDQNLDIVEATGIGRLTGVPTVVVITPDGWILNNATSAEWVTVGNRNAQAALDYFARYAPAATSAR